MPLPWTQPKKRGMDVAGGVGEDELDGSRRRRPRAPWARTGQRLARSSPCTPPASAARPGARGRRGRSRRVVERRVRERRNASQSAGSRDSATSGFGRPRARRSVYERACGRRGPRGAASRSAAARLAMQLTGPAAPHGGVCVRRALVRRPRRRRRSFELPAISRHWPCSSWSHRTSAADRRAQRRAVPRERVQPVRARRRRGAASVCGRIFRIPAVEFQRLDSPGIPEAGRGAAPTGDRGDPFESRELGAEVLDLHRLGGPGGVQLGRRPPRRRDVARRDVHRCRRSGPAHGRRGRERADVVVPPAHER